MIKSVSIHIKGVVQGVGFRPFVFRLAERHHIHGSVINNGSGVHIAAAGAVDDLDKFIYELSSAPPPLASIYDIQVEDAPDVPGTGFTIDLSATSDERDAFYSPDAAACSDCLKELFDPADRRFMYPFISCVNCGPRFTIVEDIPYDRENTAMLPFPMCPECSAEYTDPDNRRFHSQPNACPVCGPVLTLHDACGNIITSDYMEAPRLCAERLARGEIAAIKGIGGFHLACDPLNSGAVSRLRERKHRPGRPFALMADTIERIKLYYEVSPAEEKLLCSTARPIVLLKSLHSPVCGNVSPGLSWHGLMLPSAPFHFSLMSLVESGLLVMTSGNLSDEPVICDSSEAFRKLQGIADFFISYNREISARCDDSVAFVVNESPRLIRRSRGYVPVPMKAAPSQRAAFAAGGDLKSAFSIAKNDYTIMSQYLGDLADESSMNGYREAVKKFMKIFGFSPDLVLTDMHPGYFSRSVCGELFSREIEAREVQHHHAHIASVLADTGFREPVIGIAFDGTGYGEDGNLWGSEFLIVREPGIYERAGHYSYFSLPGGESSIKDIWKTGAALLACAGVDSWPLITDRADYPFVKAMIDGRINSPLTCSIGRIFDGVAAILGVAERALYEAEGAVLLEERAAVAAIPSGVRAPAYSMVNGLLVYDTADLVRRVIERAAEGSGPAETAAFFHAMIISGAVECAKALLDMHGIRTVALSGGSFQNRILLNGITSGLEAEGFRVLLPERVPFNDGCLALGQLYAGR
jgi:hydrogenase maturation protein HypF